jgi:hypothetical protein
MKGKSRKRVDGMNMSKFDCRDWEGERRAFALREYYSGKAKVFIVLFRMINVSGNALATVLT